MTWINYNHLMYFREIALHGNLTKAAKSLRISPPALSSQLKTFEENLGEKLFERRGRSLVLNSLGKKIFEHSQSINNIGEEILNIVNSNNADQAVHIRLGVADGLSKSLTSDLVLELRKKFKGIKITIFEGKRFELIANILSSELDAIFTNRICHDDYGEINSHEFSTQEISIYGTKKFIKLKANFPQSLNNQPIIMPSLHSDIRHSVDQWFMDNKLKYNMVAEVEDSAVKKILAVKEVGVTPLPEHGAQSYVDKKELYKIGKLKGVQEKYYISMKKNTYTKNLVLQYLLKNLKI